jgi:hypothetical protein
MFNRIQEDLLRGRELPGDLEVRLENAGITSSEINQLRSELWETGPTREEVESLVDAPLSGEDNIFARIYALRNRPNPSPDQRYQQSLRKVEFPVETTKVPSIEEIPSESRTENLFQIQLQTLDDEQLTAAWKRFQRAHYILAENESTNHSFSEEELVIGGVNIERYQAFQAEYARRGLTHHDTSSKS